MARNSAKLDRQLLWVTITLAAIDIGLVVAALTEHTYYNALKTSIIIMTIISLTACFVGYGVNQKHLKSED